MKRLIYGFIAIAAIAFTVILQMPVTAQQPVAAKQDRSNCESSYPDVCIPLYPPDLNCGDIEHRRFTVEGSDPHGFDGDSDGVGCES